MKYVFPKMRETWFLHVEARPLKCLRVPCLLRDAAIVSKHQDLMTDGCQNKKRCNSEEKREEGLHPCANLSDENDAINHILEEKGNSCENDKQHSASEMPERYSCGFGDKPTSTASKSGCAMPENKVENQVELCTNSMQESPSKMSTQVISVSGIINKYFTGYNGIDSSSSNSGVTSRVIHSEIEVQSNISGQSCSKKQIDSSPQFTSKTPPHVPLYVDSVSKNSGSKTRKSKVEKRSKTRKLKVEKCSKTRKSKVEECSKNRTSKVGKFLLSASKSLGVSNTKQSPALSLCKFKDKKLLEEISQIKRSIFSLCDSDD
jgi:ribosomal protein L11